MKILTVKNSENQENELVKRICRMIGLKNVISCNVIMGILFTLSALSLAFELLIHGFGQTIQGAPISNVYTQIDIMVIMILSFNLCISSIYFLFRDYRSTVMYHQAEIINKDVKDISSDNIPSLSKNKNDEKQKLLLKALKGNSYKVVEVLLEFNEINQAELGARTKIPKSTLSRILADLEKRGLIIRYKNGMSKMIKLSDELLISDKIPQLKDLSYNPADEST